MNKSARDIIASNLADIRDNMAAAARRAGRTPDDVLLVAATKTVAPDLARIAYDLGVTDVGENRVQEAQEKIPVLGDTSLRWHMIGHLQSNKAGLAARLFDMIESVDSVALAEQLSRRAGDRRLPVLLEVNVGDEPTKFGFRLAAPAGGALADEHCRFLSDVERIARLPGLEVQGLMTIAPIVAEPDMARPFFRRLRRLRDWLQRESPQTDWRHLSMGMTDDYVVAIEEGATIIRLGRALFGPRSQVGGQAHG